MTSEALLPPRSVILLFIKQPSAVPENTGSVNFAYLEARKKMPRIHSQKDTLWLLIYLESQTHSLGRVCRPSETPVWEEPSYCSGAHIISSQFYTPCGWGVSEQVNPDPGGGGQSGRGPARPSAP